MDIITAGTAVYITNAYGTSLLVLREDRNSTPRYQSNIKVSQSWSGPVETTEGRISIANLI